MQSLRNNLKLLDTSLAIDCPGLYKGPLLPKNFASHNVFIDGRILRISNYIESILKEVVPSDIEVQKSVVLPELPPNPIYVADFVLSTSSKQSQSTPTKSDELKTLILSRLNGETNQSNLSNLTAILIHVPEHYLRCEESERVVGSQAMRTRHLRNFGLNVATLRYEKLSELKAQPDKLKEYLKERLGMAGFPMH
jgi:hypothetical protein